MLYYAMVVKYGCKILLKNSCSGSNQFMYWLKSLMYLNYLIHVPAQFNSCTDLILSLYLTNR